MIISDKTGRGSPLQFVLHGGPQGPKGPKGDKGDKGDDGYSPVKGKDYFTEADKEEMVAALLNSEEFGNIENDIAALKTSVEEIRANLNYKAIEITKMSCTAGGTHEMGAVINDFTISWTLNKEPQVQILSGVALEADVRQKSYTGQNITTNKSFTLAVTDEREAMDTASTSIYFLNGVYSGVMTDGATINSAAILKLTRELRGDRKKTFAANAAAGQKHAFAIPSRYGTPTFKDAETGFQAGFYKASTIAFTNASGYTENYDVWLSTNPGMGSMTVAVS